MNCLGIKMQVSALCKVPARHCELLLVQAVMASDHVGRTNIALGESLGSSL